MKKSIYIIIGVIVILFIIVLLWISISQSQDSLQASGSNTSVATVNGFASVTVQTNGQGEIASPDPQYMIDLASINNMEEVVLVTVNGEPIFTRTLLAKKLGNERTVRNGLAQIDAMDISEQEKQEMRTQYVLKSDEEITEDLIEQELLLQEAKRRGIVVSIDTIYQQLESDYNLLVDCAENGEGDEKQEAQVILEDTKTWMKAMDYDTVDEYLSATAEIMISYHMIVKLLEQEGANMNDTSEQSAYRLLVQQLKSNATIVSLG